MKMFLMMLVISMAATTSFAKGNKKSGEKRTAKFAQRKAKALEQTDKRIARLQTLKSCLGSASDGKAMRECHKMHKKDRKEMKKHRKERRSERKQRRKERKSRK